MTKTAAFHVPSWHQGLSRSRGANKPKNVQNGTRTFCFGAKMLQSELGGLLEMSWSIQYQSLWYSLAIVMVGDRLSNVLAIITKESQYRAWWRSWQLRLEKDEDPGQRTVSVSGAGLRWPLVCQVLSLSSYTTSSGFPLKYGQADKGAAAAQYACCHNKEEAGTQFSAAKGAEHPTSLGFLGCDPQRSLDYNHLVAHPWSRPGYEDKEKRMTRSR